MYSVRAKSRAALGCGDGVGVGVGSDVSSSTPGASSSQKVFAPVDATIGIATFTGCIKLNWISDNFNKTVTFFSKIKF